MTLDELYQLADGEGIPVVFRMMNTAESLSAPFPDESCAICIDPTKLTGSSDEKMKLSHELGHCETLAFYHAHSPMETVGRQEHKARIWQIQHLIPKEELDAAVKRHLHEVWELAECFGVSEDLMREAITYYKRRFSARR